ncbi:MAG TPA: type I methionyl aminopeptidase [Polyangiaceae bacterium]|nr:type I methionyl aminopeptidase [Polyangiaceae bacterium]
MSIEGPEDLEGLRRAGAAVAEARDTMTEAAKPGISTLELDHIGRDVLLKHGARSAPKLAYDFPGWTCISVNSDLAHGIPAPDKILREGDLVNIDVSAELDGYWADSGASVAVGEVGSRLKQLLWATRQALNEAMQQARAGQPLNGIGRAVERRARHHGFRVVRNIGGHGVGRHIHEEPHVPNHFDRRATQPLWEGLVMTIEPFLTLNATHVVERDDGWTLSTPDGSLGAQFEHTFVVTNGMPLVLT